MSRPIFSYQSLTALGVLIQDSEGGWLLAAHVQPSAKKTEYVGLHGDRAKIRLAAPPIDGKANKALIAWVANALGLSKSSVSIVHGQSTRQKILRITGL